MKYTAAEINKHHVGSSKDGITWKPSRGLSYKFEPIYSRLKNAWWVLVGKYDVLDWEGY